MGTLTLDQAIQIAQVAVIAASCVLNVYLYYLTRNSKQAKDQRRAMKNLENERRDGDAKLHQRIDTISGEHNGLVARIDKRVSVIETTIRHMPTHADLTGIRNELSAINGSVAALGERSKSNNEMLHSIQKHLMDDDS